MIEWRRLLGLLVRPHCVASDWPTGHAEAIVRAAAGRERGSKPNPAGGSARLWTVSTEFLVEGGPHECTRSGGA